MEELTVQSVAPAHEDARGTVYNLIDDTKVRNVLYVESDSGTNWGNHYHKSRTQYPYILQGGFTLYYQDLRHERSTPIKTAQMNVGDVIKIPPRVAHAFELNHPTEFIEIVNKPLGENGELYDQDTVEIDGLID
ncbi:MAG: double-stranded beta-helix domain protein [halophilic archaeon J07HX5]|nr:MAG: double-stranded beta-helix domain protein [halophilic archaeon J07HX5]